MNIIAINDEKDGMEVLKKYIELLSKKENVVYVRIRFNAKHLINTYAMPLKSPLVVYTTDGFAFCLDTSVGYGGKEPQEVVDFLEYLGFEFDPDDIIQPKLVTKLDYLKEGYILEHSYRGYKLPMEEISCFPLIKKDQKQDS